LNITKEFFNSYEDSLNLKSKEFEKDLLQKFVDKH